MYNELVKLLDPIYLVGGSVRDELLGRTPKDYDFATPYTPEEMERVFRKAGKRCYNIGKRFGTMGVKIKHGEEYQIVEVTTFRTEEYALGSRKPKVQFVSNLHQDLSRRDFTINSMAKRGYKLTDPFKGQEDLKNKIIRCVGNPRQRFKEDPLRMLRAARFAAQLGFTIEADTFKKMKERAHSILEVSKERWVVELDKLLLGENVRVGLNVLMETRLLSYMIPELSLQFKYIQNSNYHSLELWEHTLKVVEQSPKNLDLRYATLLHDVAKPFVRTENSKTGYSNYIKHDLLGAELVKKIAGYLKWSNERRDKVSDLVLNHLREDSSLKQWDDLAK